MGDLQGKVIVITGASSGFGKGTALALANEGAHLVLAARRDQLLDDLAMECKAAGGKASAIATDVSDREEVLNLAREALVEMGRIDIWINNAGVGAVGRFTQVPLDIHEQVVKTDLLGTIYGSYVAWEQFLKQGKGTLINVASELGKHTVPYMSSYTAAKHGVVGLSQVLQQEATDAKLDHVRVCIVMPTAHDTPFFDHEANFTGHEVRAPEPLHDPQEVVDALVALCRNPRDEKIVGGDGVVKIAMKRLLPGAAESMATKQMHKTQLEDAPPAPTTRGAVEAPTPIGEDVSAGRLESGYQKDQKRRAKRSQGKAPQKRPAMKPARDR
jgi:short-subunit dehydrogenase